VSNCQSNCAAPVRVFFLGSGRLGLPVLARLAEADGIYLTGVATQPDRPSGRRRRLHPTPIGEYAETLGVPLLKPASVNTALFLAHTAACRPEVVVVVAFGQLLRTDMLEAAPFGCLNVHASLLPRHRGAAPVNAAILCGDDQTGVSFMKLDAGLDTGPLYETHAIGLAGTETADGLEATLGELAAERIVDCVIAVCRQGLQAVPQAAEGVSYAPKLRKQDGALDWTLPATVLERRVRGLLPWPRAYFYLQHTGGGRRIQVIGATAAAVADATFLPGDVLVANDDGLIIGCGDGALQIFRIIPEGGREMSVAQYLRGSPLSLPCRVADGTPESDGRQK